MPADDPTETRQPREFTVAAQVKGLKPEAFAYEARDTQSRGHRGLVLRVQPTGNKSWHFVYKRDGVRHRIQIGEYPGIDLASAREQANRWRVMLNDPTQPDPHEYLEQQAREKAAQDAQAAKDTHHGSWTVRKLAAEYVEALTAAGRRDRTVSEIQRHIDAYVNPVIGDEAAHAITWAGIEDVLSKAAQRTRPGKGDALTQRNAVRTTLSGLFSWATGTRKRALSKAPPKHLRGLPNPVVHTQPVEAPSKARRALTAPELIAIWSALGEAASPAHDALALILLTGCRADETARAQWSQFELDADQPTWTIPASVTKNGREHVVLLSARAVDRLRAIPGEREGFLFPNPNAKHEHVRYERINRTLGQIVKDAGLDAAITPHYFRHSLATFAEEITGSPPVRRRVLNHRTTDKLEATYVHANYDDKARDVWARWGRKLDALVSGAGNVVDLKQGVAS